jgi:hypothetical protein
MVNPIQQIQLELIKLAWERRGGQIVSDLLKHREVWDAVLADHLNVPPCSLIKLRDLPEGCWNVDTLYILVRGSTEHKAASRAVLEMLVDAWQADSWIWYDNAEPDPRRTAEQALGSSEPELALFRVWWD